MNTLAALPLPAPHEFSRPSFLRLTELELRKSVDTRAGFWLLAATALLTIVAAVARAVTGGAEDHTFRAVLELALAPTNVLLPVVAILLVTSEWSQQTATSTFTQVPYRTRLIGSKTAAAVVLGLAFFLLTIVVSIATVAPLDAGAGQWSFGWELWLQYIGFVVLGMLMGIGLGAMMLASAPAIVTYFAAPTVVAILASFKSLESVLKWVDPSAMSTPLTAGPLSSQDAQHLVTSTLIWVVTPLAIGVWRIRRADII